MQATEDKIVHTAVIAKAHLVLCGMDIHIHRGWIQLKIQHKCRVTTVVQHILIGLAYGMADQLVSDSPAIDVKMLQVGLAAGKSRQRNPPPQTQPIALYLDVNGVIHKGGATDLGNSPFLSKVVFARAPRINCPSAMAKVARHTKT